MTDLPNLAILLQSYNRPDCAIRTINGIVDNLGYNGEIAWYLADDGSEKGSFENILNALRGRGQAILGYYNDRLYPFTATGWNKGLGICYQFSNYVLVMEDDWELSGNFDMNPENHPGKFNISPYMVGGKFDIHPYIEMLSQREDVGMVRLGGLAVGNTVEIVGHNGHHYLKYLRDRSYAFSGNPSIRHARFVRSYGWYDESGPRNPGELELAYDWKFRHTLGPDIWRPSDIPGWGIFHHIGRERTFS